jgi:hypothetical protein
MRAPAEEATAECVRIANTLLCRLWRRPQTHETLKYRAGNAVHFRIRIDDSGRRSTVPYVIAAPGMLAAAAADVAGIGSSLSEANGAAAASTTRVIAAGGDEVSAAIASLFSSHGKAFQALSAQAAALHSQFVQALNAGAGAYASTEAANAGPLQTLAQNLPVPNVAVSVGGLTLLQSGSATASSQPYSGGIAIAFGAHSDATVIGMSDAVAFGTNSLAEASTYNLATAMGTNSVGVSTNGYLNMASAFGNGSAAYTENGILDTAITYGANSTAYAVNGSFNFADALGAGSTAFGGGTSPTAPGSYTVASVVGTNSTAYAGGSPTAIGAGNLAVVFGNTLDADATGNVVINIVTPIFNASL